MPPSSLLPAQFKAACLEPLLDTNDFDAWSAVVGANLGDHRSDLCSEATSFRTRMALGQSGPVQLLHIQGHGDVQLDRVQREQTAVLWLPLQGYCEEQINGTSILAEPGMALLIRPGDVLKGRTSRHLEGLSILLPSERLDGELPRLLDRGAHNRALIDTAQRFADALATGSALGQIGAYALLDQLDSWQWAIKAQLSEDRERVTAVRRRTYVGEATTWMRDHLDSGFDVAQVAAAVNVSLRTLQYAFLEECGQSPMATAKRLRLRRLRTLLQDQNQKGSSIAELMQAVGLLPCGVTTAEYRRYCGETPRMTRQSARS